MDGEDYDGAFERVEDWLNFDALAADLGGEQDGGADETALNQPLHPWDTLKYDHEPPESLGTQQQFESWDQQLESWDQQFESWDQQFESWDQQFESWDQQFESWDVLSQLLQSEEFWGLINGGTVGEQTDTGSDSDPTPEEPRTGELAPHPLAETIPLRAKSGVGCLANVPLTSRTNNLRGTKRRREEYGHNDGTVANGSSGGKENVSPSPFPEFDDMGTPASKRARQEPAEEEEEEEDGVNVGEDEELDDATSGQNGPTCGMSGCTYTLSLDYGTDWKHILGHKEVGSDEKYHCTYPGCTEKYVAKQSRNRHAISTHWGYHFVCKIARCRSQFTRSCALKVHQRSVHNIGLFSSLKWGIHQNPKIEMCIPPSRIFLAPSETDNYSLESESKGGMQRVRRRIAWRRRRKSLFASLKSMLLGLEWSLALRLTGPSDHIHPTLSNRRTTLPRARRKPVSPHHLHLGTERGESGMKFVKL
ncbi:hypothetical protein BD413DRAFT_680569 [Trametes elegans]|nr:hypothetical protein BD413DRAFT_680569 [Trametes elegans]